MTTKKKISIGILTLACWMMMMMLFALEIFMMANSGKLFPVMGEPSEKLLKN